jgi:hypothetical protein
VPSATVFDPRAITRPERTSAKLALPADSVVSASRSDLALASLTLRRIRFEGESS